ncbi:hypothetical protein ACFYOI_14675 [Streptomyces microflavus]|uniref:hypothetical protein n=1 Tax=Streptomyces microflavus TaxID=1919 RepID=UPI0033BB9356
MDTVITTRRMVFGPLPALLAAVVLTGCVAVPADSPAPRPTQAAPPAPGPDVQPAGGSDVLVRIEAGHPERARSRPPSRPPAVRPRTQGPVPQMRALCRSAGGVVSGAVSQLCRQTYGR